MIVNMTHPISSLSNQILLLIIMFSSCVLPHSHVNSAGLVGHGRNPVLAGIYYASMGGSTSHTVIVYLHHMSAAMHK